MTSNAADKQPTFTTVGSVYNPNASTPIQPPSRRPRARRYPAVFQSPTGESGFGFGYSNDLLAALPLSDQLLGSPPTAADTIQQYSPLQQNYDRAVSPPAYTVAYADQNRARNMALSALSIRSGNMPPPPSGLTSSPGLGIDKFGLVDLADEGSSSSEDTLLSHISVKGLANLASYPNPNQEACKKALAKARPVISSFTRVDTPSSYSNTSSEYGRDRSGTSRTRMTNTYGGAPQPLTAGPPGRRSARPVNLENAIKSFIDDNDDQSAQGDALIPVFNVDMFPPLNSLCGPGQQGPSGALSRAPLALPLTPLEQQQTQEKAQLPAVSTSTAIVPPRPTTATSLREKINTNRSDIHDTLPLERVRRYYPNGVSSNFSTQHISIPDDWQNDYSELTTPYDKPFSHAGVVVRETELDRRLYAGVGGGVKDVDRVLGEREHHVFKKKVRLARDERERYRPLGFERAGHFTRVLPQTLAIDEANALDSSVHLEPLLNLALAALLSHQKDKESGIATTIIPCLGNFSPADPAWVDGTEEGNNSFF